MDVKWSTWMKGMGMFCTEREKQSSVMHGPFCPAFSSHAFLNMLILFCANKHGWIDEDQII